jgi:hypothetical protein
MSVDPVVEPPLEIPTLFGWHGEEDDAPGELRQRVRIEQPHRRTEEARDLRVMAARVGGARRWIGVGMAGDAKGVELANQRERWTGATAAGDVEPDASHGEPGPRPPSERSHRLGDERGRLGLLESELRLPADSLAEPDDLFRAALDRRQHVLLQLFPGHPRPPAPIIATIPSPARTER